MGLQRVVVVLAEAARQLWAITFGARGTRRSNGSVRAWLRFRRDTIAGEGGRVTLAQLVGFLLWAANERRQWRL